MKKIVIVFVLLLIAGFYYYKTNYAKNEIAPLTLYGNVDIREVDMAFRQGGRIESMNYEEGQSVKKGDILATLQTKPLEDALSIAKANQRLAEAELEKLQAGSRKQEKAKATHEVALAMALLDRAKADFERQSKLHVESLSSEKTLEFAKAAKEEAEARVKMAKEVAELINEGVRKEDIEISKAKVEVAKNSVKQAQTALDDAKLIAPQDATISTKVREIGSMVGIKESVYSLSLGDPLYIRAYINEPELGKISPDMAVNIKASSIDKIYKGHIGFISPKAEFTPKTVETADLRSDLVYRVRIIVQNGDKWLRQGMPVTITLEQN